MTQGEARFSVNNEVNRVITGQMIETVKKRMLYFPWSREDESLDPDEPWASFSAKQMATFARGALILFEGLFPKQRCLCRKLLPRPLPQDIRQHYNLQTQHFASDHWICFREVKEITD